jgi:hypothetical protein
MVPTRCTGQLPPEAMSISCGKSS